MRLVRRTKLAFKKGTSDKVYEVDLCEAGEGEFIVNFRYGRRGSRLAEGTKTPFPEAESKAENIASKLVAEKVAKGYLIIEENGVPATGILADPVRASMSDDPRTTAVLARLRKGYSDEGWKLSRAMWRAGQWRLTGAAPLLRDLADKASGMDAWCLSWALGRCGSREDVSLLDTLIARNDGDEAVCRIAREAKFALLDEGMKDRLIKDVVAGLPASISEALSAQEPLELTRVLRELLESGDAPGNLSSDLFLVSSSYPHAREALYNVASSISTRKNGMLLLRQLFKIAEFRTDAEIYGCIAKRFESDTSNGSGFYDYKKREWVQSPFSSYTKNYFRKRIWRYLKQAGDEGDAATFIPLSTGILLAYNDELDKPEPSALHSYGENASTGNWGMLTTHRPSRCGCHSFHWLIRGEAPDLTRNRRSLSWSFSGEPTTPNRREEVYPHLWDAAPDAVSHLLVQSRAAEVQDFAIRIWENNKEWAANADIAFVISVVSSWYKPTATLGLSLAESRWNAEDPNEELLLAMFESRSEEAQEMGGQWLKQIHAKLHAFPDLIARLTFVRSETGQRAVRSGLTGVTLPADAQRQVIAKVVSGLLSFSDDAEDASCAQFATETLRLIAAPELASLPETHSAELLAHPLEELQVFATQTLIGQDKASGLPEALLLAPLTSEFPSVRQLGTQLLGTLPEHVLAQRSETLASCAISPHADLRESIRPVIEKVAAGNREFCRNLVEQFYPLVLRKENYEGLHSDIYELLSGPLADHLDAIPAGQYPRMLKSDYTSAQALGFLLLKREARLQETPLPTLIEWANHPHAELRDHIWTHFEDHPHVITSDLGTATNLLDTDWEDCRERASAFFRDKVEEADWDPVSLVSICDSTRAEIQDFGREMITRRFREEDGPLYLSRLSQHPSTELQIFASNYLMRFAAGQPDKVALLEPYFRTVLSKIGAGRTAKQRVFALLEQESLKDEPTARIVTDLLERISATIAIGDKSTCIALLHRISEQWPEISSPLGSISTVVREPRLA